MLGGAAQALVRQGVVGGVENAVAGGCGREENPGGRELLEIAGDVVDCISGSYAVGTANAARGLLFPHVEDVFTRYHVLHPEIPVTFVARSHFFPRCGDGDGLHPARGCCVDMISLI